MTADTSTMMENLLTAIDIIAEKKIESLPYDKTVLCTIVSAANAARGEYSVSDGTSTFLAYSDNTTYKENLRVYVTVPNGDFNNRKLIKGKYVANEGEYYTYVSPLDSFLDITGNVYGYKNTDGTNIAITNKVGLTANSVNPKEILIWSIGQDSLTPMLGAYEPKLTELNLNQYTRLGVGGSFSTRLNNVIAGHYGLRLEVITEVAQNDAVVTDDASLGNIALGKYTLSDELKNEVVRKVRELSGETVADFNSAVDYITASDDQAVTNATIAARGKTEFKKYIFQLDSSSMFGNPYYFIVGSKQEILFDISTINETIVGLQMYFYETPGSFKNTDGTILEIAEYNNLFVQNVSVDFGYDVNEYTEDTVLCYSTAPSTYLSTSKPEEELNEYNKKTVQARWIHQRDNGSFYAIDETNEIPTYKIDNTTSIPMATLHWYRYTLESNVGNAIAGPQWEEIEEWQDQFTVTFIPNYKLASERLKVVVEYPSQAYVANALASSEELQDISDTITSLQQAIAAETDKETRDQLNSQLTVAFAQYSKIANAVSMPVTYYSSEILEFTNESEVVNQITADLVQGLQVECDIEGYNGKYFIYNDQGKLMDQGAARRLRYLRAKYNSILSFTSEDVPETITWYIPVNNTMIAEPVEGVTYNIPEKDPYYVSAGVVDDDASIYNGFYKIVRQGLNIIDDGAHTSDTYIPTATEQIFQIKDQYIASYKNNTIYCEVKKNNITYTKSVTLEFDYGSTQGTKYTFTLTADNEAMTVEFDENDVVVDNGNNVPLLITPHIYDYNHIDVTEQYKDNIVYSWYCCKPGQLLTDLTGAGQAITATQLSGGQVQLQATPAAADANSHTLIDCFCYILQASITSTFGETDSSIRQVTLKAYYPVAIRRYVADAHYGNFAGNYLISYSSQGTNPIYYKNPFELELITDTQEQDIATYWQVAVYDKFDNELTRSWHYNIKNDFYPRFEEPVEQNGEMFYPNRLLPQSMYMNGIVKFISALGYDANTDKVLWIQPMIINQYGYESEMLNSWDGNLTIDENNDTILSAMIGAGVKNLDNTFSGVLMGQLRKANFSDDETVRNMPIGLYGFNAGAQSFGFKIDGTAFLGKSGRGQILFDGNSGTITSASFNTGNGMHIDLDDGILQIKNNNNLRVYIQPKDNYRVTNAGIVGHPYFQIYGSNNKELIHIGESNYYLQSAGYVEGTSAQAFTNGVGTRIDLANGAINSSNFKLTAYQRVNDTTSKLIYINSGHSTYPLAIHNAYTNGHLEDAPFKVDWNGKLYASNADINGKITATEGKIGNWTIGTKGLWMDGAGHNTYEDPFIYLGGSRDDLKVADSTSAIQNIIFKAGNYFGMDSNGKIWAKSGYIGGVNGWVIATNKIYSGSSNSSSTGSGDITLSTENFQRTINGTSPSNLRFAIGDKFAVAADGTLYANNAHFQGTITASTITAGSGTGQNDKAFSLSSNGILSATGASFNYAHMYYGSITQADITNCDVSGSITANEFIMDNTILAKKAAAYVYNIQEWAHAFMYKTSDTPYAAIPANTVVTRVEFNGGDVDVYYNTDVIIAPLYGFKTTSLSLTRKVLTYVGLDPVDE